MTGCCSDADAKQHHTLNPLKPEPEPPELSPPRPLPLPLPPDVPDAPDVELEPPLPLESPERLVELLLAWSHGSSDKPTT